MGDSEEDLHLALVHPPVDAEVVEVLAVVVEVVRVVEGALVVVVLVEGGLVVVVLVDAGLVLVDWLLAGGWEPHSKTAGPGMV